MPRTIYDTLQAIKDSKGNIVKVGDFVMEINTGEVHEVWEIEGEFFDDRLNPYDVALITYDNKILDPDNVVKIEKTELSKGLYEE